MSTFVIDLRTKKQHTYVCIREWSIQGRTYAPGHIDHVPHVEALSADNKTIMIPLNYAEIIETEKEVH